jgi:hypothetical protein
LCGLDIGDFEVVFPALAVVRDLPDCLDSSAVVAERPCEALPESSGEKSAESLHSLQTPLEKLI